MQQAGWAAAGAAACIWRGAFDLRPRPPRHLAGDLIAHGQGDHLGLIALLSMSSSASLSSTIARMAEVLGCICAASFSRSFGDGAAADLAGDAADDATRHRPDQQTDRPTDHAQRAADEAGRAPAAVTGFVDMRLALLVHLDHRIGDDLVARSLAAASIPC